jgi:hypothetical protein
MGFSFFVGLSKPQRLLDKEDTEEKGSWINTFEKIEVIS